MNQATLQPFTNVRDLLTFTKSIHGDCSILADADIVSHRHRPNLSNSTAPHVYQIWYTEFVRMSYIGDLPFVRVWRRVEVENPGVPVADIARLVARQLGWV